MRVNLDVFWAREPGTVRDNLNRMRRDVGAVLAAYDIEDDLLPLFSNPKLDDRVGMSAALTMLRASLNKGWYCENVQFDTVRKTITWISNV